MVVRCKLGKLAWIFWSCLLFAQVVIARAAPAAPPEVWFMSAGQSPDLTDLFTRPAEWAKARQSVNVFAFGPGHLTPAREGQPSLYSELVSVGAFRLIKSWGMKISIEVPALKEWDCAGAHTPEITEQLIRRARDQGGDVRYVAMDEPLISGLGLNVRKCALTIAEAAQVVAKYAKRLGDLERQSGQNNPVGIVDIEAYPSVSVAQIKQWITYLVDGGVKLSGFHLDPNVHYIDIHPDIKNNLKRDLSDLQAFLKEKGIPFGVIIWSGYDPVKSDRAYYDYAMAWARAVHASIGSPDRLIFQSWVRRCGLNGPCTGRDMGCGASDPPYCGKSSVPLNLPEEGRDVFTQTRLVLDVLSLFSH